jgi:hypothetical protein
MRFVQKSIPVLLVTLMAVIIAASLWESPKPVLYTTSVITVSVDGIGAELETLNIGNYNYVNINDLALALDGTAKRFYAEFDGESGRIFIYPNRAGEADAADSRYAESRSLAAVPSYQTLVFNGAEFNVRVYAAEDSRFIRLRDIGRIMDFAVDWDYVNETVLISTDKGYNAAENGAAYTTPPVVKDNARLRYNLRLVSAVCAAVTLFAVIYTLLLYIHKNKGPLNVYPAAYFIAAIPIQVIFVIMLEYEPRVDYDVRLVFDGAVSLARHGHLTDEVLTYFAWFSNNFGFAYIMSLFLRIFGVFTQNHFMVFALFNIAAVNIGVYFLYDAVRRSVGEKAACCMLAALFLYIPMYFFPSMIYTDTVTMCVPIICLNLSIRIREGTAGRRTETLYYTLMGAVSGLGMVIKPTAAIMFIAVVIICCVFIRTTKVYNLISLSLTVFVLTVLLFQIPYRLHVPKEMREADSIPYSHWVMMGLQDKGQANWDEFLVTMSFPTRSEKNANAAETIKQRLSEMGISGYIRLIGQKYGILYSRSDFKPEGVIAFGGSAESFKLERMKNNSMFYSVYNGIMFYGVIFLALISIFLYTRNCTAYLAVFGANLFFMLWEVNPRYMTNYYFIYVFLACLTVKAAYVYIIRQRSINR